jgi:hypothetical protein
MLRFCAPCAQRERDVITEEDGEEFTEGKETTDQAAQRGWSPRERLARAERRRESRAERELQHPKPPLRT